MQSTGFARRCNEHDARTCFDWQRTMHLLFFENITFLGDSCTYSNPESPLFLSAGKHRAATRVLCPIQDAQWLTMGSVEPVDTTLSCECCGQKYLG